MGEEGTGAMGDEQEGQFENTYRLEPHDEEKFEPGKVKECIAEVFKKKFGEGFEYNADDAAEMGTEVCTEIQERIKELGYKRYKLITQVTIGEMKGQTMRIGSRCLCDVNNDNCASEVLQNVSSPRPPHCPRPLCTALLSLTLCFSLRRINISV